MRADRGFVIAVIVVVAVAGSILAFPRDADAQTSSTVDFLVADSVVSPTNAPNDPGDILVVTGKPLGTADGTGCAPPGQYPVHDVVVIDPGFNRATRLTGLIFFVASTDPVRPGTKIGNITALTGCALGVTSYTKYRGTVE